MEKVFCKGKRRGMSPKVLVLLVTASIMFAMVPTMNIARAPIPQVIIDEDFESTAPGPGNLPPGWVEVAPSAYVYDWSGNRKHVLRIDDTESCETRAKVAYDFATLLTNGVLEFKLLYGVSTWWNAARFYLEDIRTSDPSYPTRSSIWHVFIQDDVLTYLSGGNWVGLTTLSPNTWYDFKLSFDLENGADLYLNSVLILSNYPAQVPNAVATLGFASIWCPATDSSIDDVVLTTSLPEPADLFSDVLLILPMAVLAGTLLILRKRKRNAMEN